MSEKIKVSDSDSIYIKGYCFKKENIEKLCELEEHIPEDAYVYSLDGARIYAVKSKIGQDEHPLLHFVEAARYIDFAWVVGIDTEKNRYFTPIFTNP